VLRNFAIAYASGKRQHGVTLSAGAVFAARVAVQQG
jgi:hypothetical protein